MSLFVDIWNVTATLAHESAKKHGFWEGEKNKGELLALVHSEVSEALEALRKQPLEMDAKITQFREIEVELADIVIRVMDMAHAFGWNVAAAVEAKMEFNKTRPYKHGKEF